MKADERERLIGNIVASMKGVPPQIQGRQIWHFKQADLAYGAGVAQGLGFDINDIKDINIRNSKEVAAD
jgi:catalase